MQTFWFRLDQKHHVNPVLQRIYVFLQCLALATVDPAMVVRSVQRWRNDRGTDSIVILILSTFSVFLTLIGLAISANEFKETNHSILFLPFGLNKAANSAADEAATEDL